MYFVTRQREGDLVTHVANTVAVGVVGNKHTTSAGVQIVIGAKLGHIVGTVDVQEAGVASRDTSAKDQVAAVGLCVEQGL